MISAVLDPCGVSVMGDAEGYTGLVHFLLFPEEAFALDPPTEVRAEESVLSRVRLRSKDFGRLLVEVTEAELVITGPERFRANIVYAIVHLLAARPQKPRGMIHAHIEAYPGHSFLEERSEPLVIDMPDLAS